MYFLVASGLSLIYGLMGVLNFAHGSVLLTGAYLVAALHERRQLIAAADREALLGGRLDARELADGVRAISYSAVRKTEVFAVSYVDYSEAKNVNMRLLLRAAAAQTAKESDGDLEDLRPVKLDDAEALDGQAREARHAERRADDDVGARESLVHVAVVEAALVDRLRSRGIHDGLERLVVDGDELGGVRVLEVDLHALLVAVEAGEVAVADLSGDLAAGRFDQALPLFARFCEGTVLVGHNVGFDMRFLELKEAQTGVRLTQPVLDTLLLVSVVPVACAVLGLYARARGLLN